MQGSEGYKSFIWGPLYMRYHLLHTDSYTELPTVEGLTDSTRDRDIDQPLEAQILNEASRCTNGWSRRGVMLLHLAAGLGSWQVAGCAPGLLRLKGCGSTAGLGQLVIPVPIQDRHV